MICAGNRLLRSRARSISRALLPFYCLLVLAACATAPPIPQGENSLSTLYASRERKLLNAGRLRLETDPADAPFGVPELARNFERIAFFQEFVTSGQRLIKNETQANLRRFEGPVRVTTLFGGSVPRQRLRRDQAEVERFTAKLARLTGLDMAMSSGNSSNFFVLFLNRQEQKGAVEILRQKVPGVPPSVTHNFRDSPDNIYCTAYSFASPRNPSRYKSAIVLIKAEHPDLTRLSCIHEEMAQAMGLSNDSKAARPSIFNDDEEFSLLTRHDAALLRMLYDKRLRPGMSLSTARPLLPQIATDALRSRLN